MEQNRIGTGSHHLLRHHADFTASKLLVLVQVMTLVRADLANVALEATIREEARSGRCELETATE